MEATFKYKKHFKSERTEQYSLVLALSFLHTHDVTDTILERKYDLGRMTLAKIRNGDEVKRGAEHYYNMFVRVLNDLRLKAISTNDLSSAEVLTTEIRDVALVHAGIATDCELNEKDKVETRKMMFNV